MITLNQVKALLDSFEELKGNILQADIKPLIEMAVAEYLDQDNKNALTTFELSLLITAPQDY